MSQALEIASCTDPGMVRSHNEDSHRGRRLESGLVVLADGMGGYNAGEVASGMATTVITTEMQHLLADTPPYKIEPATGKPFADRLLREQIAKANTSIFQAAQSQPQYSGMGTTLVARHVLRQQGDASRTSATPAPTACAARRSSSSPATIRCCRSRSTAG